MSAAESRDAVAIIVPYQDLRPKSASRSMFFSFAESKKALAGSFLYFGTSPPFYEGGVLGGVVSGTPWGSWALAFSCVSLAMAAVAFEAARFPWLAA